MKDNQSTADNGNMKECRESFEQWILNLWDVGHLRTDGVGTYVCVHTFLKWQAWQVAWNHHPRKYTEVGRVGLTDDEIHEIVKVAVKENRLFWLGYDEDEDGRYTIPSMSNSHYQLARAIERAIIGR